MKQSADYMLYKLNGIPYLLPFGQGIADMRRGVRINDTGAYVWNLLEKEISEEEIVSCCASHFQADSWELPLLRADILQFLNLLRLRGLLADVFSFPEPSNVSLSLCIGGLRIGLAGAGDFFPKAFSPFASNAPSDFFDQIIEIRPFSPAAKSTGPVLLRSRNLIVMEGSAGYTVLFPAAESPLEATVSPDGSRVVLSAAGTPTEPFLKDIFHAIRLCFLCLAQRKGLFALHSASILYRENIWLFSGHSGAGKSTHTNLWKGLMRTPLINGDLNLLDNNGSVPTVHGLPWCGTSDISTPGTWPLGGIIFLRQAPLNRIQQLPDEEKQLMIAQHMISPSWTREQAGLLLDAAGAISSHILVCRLCCTKDREAVETARAAMDEWLSSR